MTADDNAVMTIPHDFEAEQAVLGAIIFNNQTMNNVASILSPLLAASDASIAADQGISSSIEK